MEAIHWNRIALRTLLAITVLTSCTSPLTPPPGYSDVPDIRIEVIPDSRASPRDLRVLRSEEHVLALGVVQNDTMLSFRGGRVEAELLDASGGIKAQGSGTIRSSQVGPHGSAPFRVAIEYGGPFDTCRIIVLPDVEGR